MAEGTDTYLGLIKRRWEASKTFRLPYDYLWEVCMRKHAGQHWIRWDPEGRRFVPSQPGRKDIRLRRTNLIRRDCRSVRALMKRTFPRAICQPGKGEGSLEQKRMAAEIGQGLLETWHMERCGSRQIDRIIGTCQVTGNAFEGLAWNVDDERAYFEREMPPKMMEGTRKAMVAQCLQCGAQQEVAIEQIQQGVRCECGTPLDPGMVRQMDIPDMVPTPQKDEDGNPLMEKVARGDVDIPYVSPLEIFPQRTAPNLEEAGYIFRLRHKSSHWIKQVTGTNETIPTVATSTGDLHQWLINSITGVPDESGLVDDSTDEEVSDLSFFLEYMEAPNARNKKGLYLAFGDESLSLVVDKDTYRDFGPKFGLTHYGYEEVPNRFWYAGMVEDLYPVNDQLNAEITQSDYMRTRFLFMKWVKYRNSGVANKDLSGNNEVVSVDEPDLTPKLVGPSSPMPELHQGIALTMNRFREMSGNKPTVSGEQEGSIRTTSGLAGLHENAIMPYMEVVGRWAEQYARHRQFALRLAQRKYDTKRSIEIMGKGSVENFKVFKASDFKLPGLSVTVETDNIAPITRAERREAHANLMQYSQGGFWQLIMQDPMMWEHTLELYGLKPQNWNVQYNMHRREAQLEMVKFLENPQQYPLQVDPLLELHPIHYQVHEEWLKTEGLSLKWSGDQVQMQLYMAVAQHALQHKQILMQQQMQQPLQPGTNPNETGSGAPPSPPPQ